MTGWEASGPSKVAIAERMADRCYPDFRDIFSPMLHRAWREQMWPELHALVQAKLEEWLGERVTIIWLPTERSDGAWIATTTSGQPVRLASL